MSPHEERIPSTALLAGNESKSSTFGQIIRLSDCPLCECTYVGCWHTEFIHVANPLSPYYIYVVNARLMTRRGV